MQKAETPQRLQECGLQVLCTAPLITTDLVLLGAPARLVLWLCVGMFVAGVAYKGNTFGADEAAATIATNFLGTKAVCEALLPLLTKPGGRIVNVSST